MNGSDQRGIDERLLVQVRQQSNEMISDQMRLGTCSGVEREKGKSPNSLIKEILTMLIACMIKPTRFSSTISDKKSTRRGERSSSYDRETSANV